MTEKDIRPKFCKCADLACQAMFRAERYLPWSSGHHQQGDQADSDIIEQVTKNVLIQISI